MKRWLGWVVACTVAFGVAGSSVVLSPSPDLIVTANLGVAVSLFLAGVLQWLLLRGEVNEAGRWVVANTTAVAVIGVSVFGIGRMDPDAGWVLGVVVGWVALGVLQWRVLRREIARAGWWVVATMLGLLVAVPVVGFVSWVTGTPDDGTVGRLLRWAAFGAAYGAVTGSALCWLLGPRAGRRRDTPRRARSE